MAISITQDQAAIVRFQERADRIIATRQTPKNVSFKEERKWSYDPGINPMWFALSLVITLGLISIIACNALHLWHIKTVGTTLIHLFASHFLAASAIAMVATAFQHGIGIKCETKTIPLPVVESPEEKPKTEIVPFPLLEPISGKFLPRRTIQNILSFLTIKELGSVKLVSKAMKLQSEDALITRAKEYGFSGSDLTIKELGSVRLVSKAMKLQSKDALKTRDIEFSGSNDKLAADRLAASVYLSGLFREIRSLQAEPLLKGIIPKVEEELIICQMPNRKLGVIFNIYSKTRQIETLDHFTQCLLKLIPQPKETSLEALSDEEKKLGQSALRRACMYFKVKMCELLVRLKVDINAVDADGDTPLNLIFSMREAIPQDAETMDALTHLLFSMESLKQKNNDGYTPLENSVKVLHLSLLKREDVDIGEGEGNALAHLAILNRNIDLIETEDRIIAILQTLISKGQSIHAPTADGACALHVAVKQKYPRVVEFLLENGANLNCKNQKGETPLSLSLESIKGSKKIARILLQRNASREGLTEKQKKRIAKIEARMLTKNNVIDSSN